MNPCKSFNGPADIKLDLEPLSWLILETIPWSRVKIQPFDYPCQLRVAYRR